MELSPGSFRTFVVGTSYQLGNLASSASSTIESTIGSQFPLSPIISTKDGKTEVTKRYNYGKVICIFLGCVYAYVIILTLVGPERRNRNFEVEHDSDMAEVTHTNLRSHHADQVEHGDAEYNSSDDDKALRHDIEKV